MILRRVCERVMMGKRVKEPRGACRLKPCIRTRALSFLHCLSTMRASADSHSAVSYGLATAPAPQPSAAQRAALTANYNIYRHTVRGSAQRNSLGPGAIMDKSGCVYRRSIAKCRAPCAGSWPAQAEYCGTGNRKTSLRTGIPAAFHACGHRGLKYKNQELRGEINCRRRISK